MQIIKPPTILPEYPAYPTIFLAGSIEMGVASDWQTTITEAMNSRLAGTIYNPRRDEWDSSWEQDISNPHFRSQVEWELQALDRATFILMYFDPNTKSPISLLELGLYARSKRLTVACPEGYWKRGNVQVVCDMYNIPLLDSLEQLKHSAVSLHSCFEEYMKK